MLLSVGLGLYRQTQFNAAFCAVLAGSASYVALALVQDLLLRAKHLFVAAIGGNCRCRGLKDEPWHRFSPEF
jgi:hypothetical protein